MDLQKVKQVNASKPQAFCGQKALAYAILFLPGTMLYYELLLLRKI